MITRTQKISFLVGGAVLAVGGAIVVATSAAALPKKVVLPVPYASQAPYGNWQPPWDEACEETSAAMVEAYYTMKEKNPTAETKQFVQKIIDWEKEHFISIEDTTAEQTVAFIEATTSFGATVQRNPTLQAIKQELADGRPVLALVDMYQLYQERSEDDSYHVLVIIGYDDAKEIFVVNDPARSKKEYSYTTLMNSLHDFNNETKEADGTPTVIFTHS